MSNLNIQAWFPRAVGYVDRVCDLERSSLLAHVQNHIHSQGTRRDPGFWVDSTHKTADQLHLDPAMQALVQAINEYSSIFLQAQGWTAPASDRVRVAQMWANSSTGTDYLFPHVHPGSVLSGAYYLSALDPVSSITFYRDLSNMFPEAAAQGMFSDETCDYPCTPGRLILFRSDFMHGFKPSPGQGTKVVVSFNLLEHRDL